MGIIEGPRPPPLWKVYLVDLGLGYLFLTEWAAPL